MINLDELFAPPAPPPPTILDRSTAERYAVCPFQGLAVETGLVADVTDAAVSGITAHQVLSDTVVAVLDDASDAAGEGLVAAQMARPDVQPDVLEAVRWSLRGVVHYLRYLDVDQYPAPRRNPADVLRHDAGRGDRSGQLACDILPAVRLTSRLDLLMAGPDKQTLDETDFKTGYMVHNAGTIAHSFQFQLHALLIFKTYPTCNFVRCRVWSTRFNSLTRWTEFRRDRIGDLEGRMLTAIRARELALAAIPAVETVETWPTAEKCEQCPARRVCPRVQGGAWRIMDEPADFAKATEVMALEVAAREKALVAYAKEHGPIQLGDGRLFGLPPVKPKKPTAASYKFFDERTETGE